MNATSRRYDDVPYPDFIHPRMDPAHLAAVARLHGLETALPGRGTRVLEIGCGQAGNLLSLASMYPDAEFVGTDLSAKQIASGETLRAAAGIKNLRLTVADVTRWRDQGRDVFAGKFDFILVHGVYSWVPDEARRAILQICQEKLTDIGLALVSYNTYPGWHLKMMVRDLMHRVKPHSEVDEHDPVAGITARIDAIEQISKLAPANSAYGTTLREAVGLLRRSEPAYLYHEQFEQINRPRWFQTFAAELGSYSLQHVTDANLVSSEIHALPESNRAALDLLPHVEAEQQLDLFINRTFRESIVVRDHRTFDRQHKPDVWQTLHFASALPTNDASLITRAELSPEQPLEIKTPSGLTIAIAATTTQKWLAELIRASPSTRMMDDITGGPDTSDPSFGQQCELLIRSGCVDVRATSLRLCDSVPDRPLASVLNRVQASMGRVIASPRHRAVRLDPATAALLELADGSRDADALLVDWRLKLNGSARIDVSISARQLKRLATAGLFLPSNP